MKLVKTFSLMIITGLLIVMIPFSLFAHALNQTVLEPYSWNEITAEVDLGHIIHTVIEDRMTEIEFTYSDDFAEIYRDIIKKAIDKLVTSEWVQMKLDELQVHIWDYLLEVTERVEPLTMVDLKATVMNEFNVQLNEMNIPEFFADQIMLEMETQLPEELDVTHMLALDNGNLEQVRDAYMYSQRGNDSLLIITLLLFGCGLLIAFYPKLLFRWSGYLIGLVGLFTWVGFKLVTWLPIEQSVEGSLPMGSLGESGSRLLVFILTESVQAATPFLLILLSVGIILIGLSHLPLVGSIDQRLRKMTSRNTMIYTVRGIIIAFIIVMIGWQTYQLTTPI